MAITVDVANLGTATQTAAGTTMSFTTSAAVASGARIVVTGGCWDSVSTVSSVSGGGLTWTIDKQGHALTPMNPNPYIVSADAPSGLASGTTITVTFNLEADVAGTVGGSSFFGIDTTTPVDTTSGPLGVSPAATAWASNSTTILAGSLLIATCWNETNNSTSTPGAGSTEALDFSSADQYGQTTAYRIEASAGSYTVSGTWGTAAQTTTVAVAYKEAAGGTNATVTPAVIALTTTLPRPAVNVGAGPSVISAAVTLPAATLSGGATTTPATIAATVTLPQPAVNVGAGPVVIPVTVTLPTPTIETGGNVTAQPATIACTVTIPRPAVDVGAGPAVVATTVTIPQPGANVAAGPTVIPVTVSLPQATTPIDGTPGPATITALASMPAAGVNVSAGPSVIAVTVTLPQATISTPGATVKGTGTVAIDAPSGTITVAVAAAVVAIAAATGTVAVE